MFLNFFLVISFFSQLKRPNPDSSCPNVFYQNHRVSREKRAESLSNGRQFRGCTVWFTGKCFVTLLVGQVHFFLFSLCSCSTGMLHGCNPCVPLSIVEYSIDSLGRFFKSVISVALPGDSSLWGRCIVPFCTQDIRSRRHFHSAH